MPTNFWLMIIVAAVLILLGVFFIIFSLKQKQKHRPDYYTFFIMGIIWLPVGIAIKNYGLALGGLILMIFGLLKKDEWKLKQRNWNKMNSYQKKILILIRIFLGLLVLVGIIFMLIY